MKKLLFLLFSMTALAEVPITNLPAFTGAQVGSTDVIPFVNLGSNTTGKLQLSQIFSIPSLQNPTFSGLLTTPSGAFLLLSVVSGSFTTGAVVSGPFTMGSSPVYHNLNTVTAASASCGAIAGATGCVKIKLNGTIRYLPYF